MVFELFVKGNVFDLVVVILEICWLSFNNCLLIFLYCKFEYLVMLFVLFDLSVLIMGWIGCNLDLNIFMNSFEDSCLMLVIMVCSCVSINSLIIIFNIFWDSLN